VEVRLETAQANLDAVLADPSQEQLTVAQVQIDSAEFSIHVLESQIKRLTIRSQD
jgi:hypothetical protein